MMLALAPPDGATGALAVRRPAARLAAKPAGQPGWFTEQAISVPIQHGCSG